MEIHNFHYPIDLTNNLATYSVTELILYVQESLPPLYFDRLLQSFPDLESLQIDGYRLENEHLSVICQHMPKLKKLVLRLEVRLSQFSLLYDASYDIFLSGFSRNCP